MNSRPSKLLPKRFQALGWTMIGLTLLIFLAAIYWVSQHMRQQIRQQIVARDGEILHAVALRHQQEQIDENPMLGAIEEPANQFETLLKISSLKGVIAARLFDPEGNFSSSFPFYVKPQDRLQANVLQSLRQLEPVSRYHPRARLDEIFYQLDDAEENSGEPFPMLEVTIPFHPQDQDRLVGAAQFLIDGETISEKYAALDRLLLRQTGVIFLIGGGLIAIGLGWTFHRLQRTNRLLAKRSTDLLRANQELNLQAKTSAVGSVTAHLIHGLKNPLSGLHQFVSSRAGANGGDHHDTDWQEAVQSTRRMQTFINEIVTVLRQDEAQSHYEITLSELIDLIRLKVDPTAEQREVKLLAHCPAEGTLSSRTANLATLILVNLLNNAIQATPPGMTVVLKVSRDKDRIRFEVHDQGPGIPPEKQSQLFAPCRSHKEGGAGIGLAITKQLANHIGAEVRLESNSPQGCVFAFSLPDSLLLENQQPQLQEEIAR